MTMPPMPKFHPDVPDIILKQAKSDLERHQLNEASITRQQNEWLIARMMEGDARFDRQDKAIENLEKTQAADSERIKSLEEIKTVVTAKSSVIIAIFLVLLIPSFLLFVGAYAGEWVKGFFK